MNILKLFNHHLDWEDISTFLNWKEQFKITWIDKFDFDSKKTNQSLNDYSFISDALVKDNKFDKIKQIATIQFIKESKG